MNKAQLSFKLKAFESRLENFLPNYSHDKESINPTAIISSTEKIIMDFLGYIPKKVQVVLNRYNDIEMISNNDLIDKFINEITDVLINKPQ